MCLFLVGVVIERARVECDIGVRGKVSKLQSQTELGGPRKAKYIDVVQITKYIERGTFRYQPSCRFALELWHLLMKSSNTLRLDYTLSDRWLRRERLDYLFLSNSRKLLRGNHCPYTLGPIIQSRSFARIYCLYVNYEPALDILLLGDIGRCRAHSNPSPIVELRGVNGCFQGRSTLPIAVGGIRTIEPISFSRSSRLLDISDGLTESCFRSDSRNLNGTSGEIALIQRNPTGKKTDEQQPQSQLTHSIVFGQLPSSQHELLVGNLKLSLLERVIAASVFILLFFTFGALFCEFVGRGWNKCGWRFVRDFSIALWFGALSQCSICLALIFVTS